MSPLGWLRGAAIWGAAGSLLVAPLIVAGQSPLLAWREMPYILAGFAGIFGLALMLLQPLLMARVLPGVGAQSAGQYHRIGGIALVAAVIVHVAGLWITSPPDVIDVLLFRSPTPFGVWGAIALWAVFAAGIVATLRRKLRPKVWRLGHAAFVAVAVVGTVLHAILIEGTMGPVSKVVLCIGVTLALLFALYRRRIWQALR